MKMTMVIIKEKKSKKKKDDNKNAPFESTHHKSKYLYNEEVFADPSNNTYRNKTKTLVMIKYATRMLYPFFLQEWNNSNIVFL